MTEQDAERIARNGPLDLSDVSSIVKVLAAKLTAWELAALHAALDNTPDAVSDELGAAVELAKPELFATSDEDLQRLIEKPIERQQ